MSATAFELRVALVLYGGVSLAVYENGVVRCFHDLVRGRGVFRLLREILDANAIVDVIAGTSAGGINGLLLAAALENGTDFKETAQLWRKQGDLGALLRPVSAADDAESLLDGEGRYQRELVKALRTLCTPSTPPLESPSEMDVFLTGTDLDGGILKFWDDLGQEIRDKTHRTVFHLKHRFGRKALGLGGWKNEARDSEIQAWILASIARITGTFPVAFPPFQLKQIDDAEIRGQVAQALTRTAGRGGGPRTAPAVDERTSFIDGGVLDNKPFGPALRAIFYRMPSAVTERRLFYIEPDPDPLGDHAPDPERHTPFRVAAAALTTIPGHESIYGDLEQLRRHNERVRWSHELRDKIRERSSAPGPEQEALYWTSRIESLARALLLDSDVAPSASDRIADPHRLRLLGPLCQTLGEMRSSSGREIDACDPDFHLRRAYRMLYAYGAELRSHPLGDTQSVGTTLRLLGRVIKAIKLVRDATLGLREKLVAEWAKVSGSSDEVSGVLDLYRRFLCASAQHWQPLLEALPATIELSVFAGEERRLLESRELTRTAERAFGVTVETLRQALPLTGPTILTRLEGFIRELDVAYESSAARFIEAERLEVFLYPFEFASSIYEVDQVRLVRISPRDAQIGLSLGSLEDKVTGEDLAHFSAFLRQDWRANDILRGRLDGICQIVRAYLDLPAFRRLRQQGQRLEEVFKPDALRLSLERCPDWHDQVLAARDAMTQAWKSYPGAPPDDMLLPEEEAFRNMLIHAAQVDAFLEEIEDVRQAHEQQEIEWGQRKGPGEVTSEAPATATELAAQEAAHGFVRGTPFDKLWGWFAQIGPQTVLGEDGAVPRHILAEYLTRAYLLLWGMTARSLHPRGAFLQKRRTRLFFRTPLAVLNLVLNLIRKDARSAALLITGISVTLFAVAGVSLYHGHTRWGWAALIILAVFATLITWLSPDKTRGAIAKILVAAAIAGLLGLVLVWVGAELVESVRHWWSAMPLGAPSG